MDNIDALVNMHKLLLEALRHREQEIIRYLAILGPALGGFLWLILADQVNNLVFIAGTIGVLFLLLLGAFYSLALGYNYRYITLQLAKLETNLGISDAMLEGWPKSPKDFLKRYSIGGRIPWCTPPEVIWAFWLAFVVGIVGVTATACMHKPEVLILAWVSSVGVFSSLAGFLLPIHFGQKLREHCNKELEEKPIIVDKRKCGNPAST